jgi:hypothetical protein
VGGGGYYYFSWAGTLIRKDGRRPFSHENKEVIITAKTPIKIDEALEDPSFLILLAAPKNSDLPPPIFYLPISSSFFLVQVATNG